jgi:transcriptional regulator with XRE-family HTH domain
MAETTTIDIRTKKLAALIKDARNFSGKTIKECADLLGISTYMMSAYEQGDKAPSLPELEVLAYYLDVPIEHFWGQQSIQAREEARIESSHLDRVLPLRQRIVGVMLRKARLEAGLQLEELVAGLEVDADQLEAYEMGEEAIPLPLLETLIERLNRLMREFQDREGPVGRWISQQTAKQAFLDLPLDLQQFVTRPINRPYLELAQRLSEMSVDKLRAVAEGLLEITL